MSGLRNKISFCIGILTVLLTFNTAIAQNLKLLEQKRFSFQYPAEWEARSISGYDALVSEVAQNELIFMSTFDVQIKQTEETIDGYTTDYENRLKNSVFNSFKIKSKEKISFKGYEAIEYVCSAKVQEIPIKWKTIIIKKNGMIYKLSTTSIVGKFYLLEDKTNKIFESFTFK